MAVQTLPTGKYRVQVMIAGKVRGHVWTRKADAVREEALLQREQEFTRAGIDAPTEEILFFDYARKYLNRRKKTHPAATWKQDELILRTYWLEPFGTRPLMSITRLQVREKLQEFLDKGISNAYHNRILQCLHKLYEEAIDDNKASINPVSRIKRLTEKKRARRVGVWENSATVELYLEEARRAGVAYYCFGVLALFTGMRVGEALALQNRDISWRKRQIVIQRTLERVTQTIHERTKGQKYGGEYILPLLPRAMQVIQETVTHNNFKGPSDFILQKEDGSHLSYWTVRSAHERICKKANIPYSSIHTLRHYFATMMEEAGFDRGDIQKIFDHSSVKTTEGYLHKNIDRIVEKVDRLGVGSLNIKPNLQVVTK